MGTFSSCNKPLYSSSIAQEIWKTRRHPDLGAADFQRVQHYSSCRDYLPWGCIYSVVHDEQRPKLQVLFALMDNLAVYTCNSDAVAKSWDLTPFCSLSSNLSSQVILLRYKMTQSSVGSLMLEGYYSFGEKMDPSNKIREHDIKTWRMQGREV